MSEKFFILGIICMIFLCGVAFASDTENIPLASYSVGYYTNGLPMQSADVSQKATGISIDILKEIGVAHDIEFYFYPVSNASNMGFINTLDINIIYNNAMLTHNTFTRKTNPYYGLKLVLVASSNAKNFDLSEKIDIGILDYNTLDESLMNELIPNANIILYDNTILMQDAFLAGKLECFFTAQSVAQDFIFLYKDKNYQIYPVEITVPLTMYLSDNLPENTEELFNRFIQELDITKTTRIVIENTKTTANPVAFMSKTTSYDATDMLHHNILVACTVIILSGIAFFFYYRHICFIMFYDKLTGTLSEYKFNMMLAKALKKAKPNEYALITVDIDKFQHINENYGYDVGTHIIKEFSNYLKKQYPTGKLIARVHADEFYLLVKNRKNEEDFLYHSPFYAQAGAVSNYNHIYFSMGIFIIQDSTLSATSIIGNANFARTVGKQTHGDTRIIFTAEMEKERNLQTHILSTMEQALKDKEFHVYYQPKMQLQGKNTICGAEALVRWLPKNGSPIFPDQFIPLFEKNMYIIKLDLYVLEETCIFIKNHRKETENIVISVNLSTVSMLQSDLVTNIMNILEKHAINIHNIELEVTESAVVDNMDFIISQLNKFKELGFSVALDDFGSGISSLNQLKNLTLDVIKLDKEFLADSLNQSKGIVIIEQVIEMSKKLELTIVAEGVETKSDVDLLTKLNCDIAQGYFFAKPMPSRDFLSFIEKNQ
ncbi:MAG: EAL domain-containing protein [Spirochaetales bacterium]